MHFADIIQTLNAFWQAKGCIITPSLDRAVGAGTFHPATFLRALGPEPWAAAYTQASTRPADGRYGENPNRLGHYYQYQVIMKPAPATLQADYVASLQALGLDIREHDIRFVEDNWESPTLGAKGLGWEVWLNGMEITQFTYFQQVGGLPVDMVSGEITYGLERIAMYLQGVDSVYDLTWQAAIEECKKPTRYGDLYLQGEQEWAHYYFTHADTDALKNAFTAAEAAHSTLIDKKLPFPLPLPAYDEVLKASHIFNALDARGALSVTERQAYMLAVRTLAASTAEAFVARRRALGFPLICEDNATHTANHTKDNQTAAPVDLPETVSLLIEIGCEELPAGVQSLIEGDLARILQDALDSARLYYERMTVDVTPRRIAVRIASLTTKQATLTTTIKGPKVSAPEAAIQGFARKMGVEIIDLATDGDYYTYTKMEPGQSLPALIAPMLHDALEAISLPARMVWPNTNHQPKDTTNRFIRPVRSLVVLADDVLLPAVLFGVPSGHTAMKTHEGGMDITIQDANDYEATLQASGVVLNAEKRKATISAQIQEILRAESTPTHLVEDDDLLDEITALCECPAAFIAEFPERFLQLPRECLVHTLAHHQRYLCLEDDEGNLCAKFIGVANTRNTTKATSEMTKGNERVVAARLADAEFFYNNDLQVGLDTYADRLDKVLFMKGLGSLANKRDRLVDIASKLSHWIGMSDKRDKEVARAAHLAKADLVSQMVIEFPKLQGVMGGHYARKLGEGEVVATAIAEHYQPRFANDAIPQSEAGQILALADKLDTLVAIFTKHGAPTGSKDPFALRRTALGIARIVIEDKIPMSLGRFMLAVQHAHKGANEKLCAKVCAFIVERLAAYYEAQGIERRLFQAIANHAGNPVNVDLLAFDDRLRTLNARYHEPEFPMVLNAYKRMRPFINANDSAVDINPSLLNAEGASLHTAMQQYNAPWAHLLTLAPKIEAFVEATQIEDANADIAANNRALLAGAHDVYQAFVDFSPLA